MGTPPGTLALTVYVVAGEGAVTIRVCGSIGGPFAGELKIRDEGDTTIGPLEPPEARVSAENKRLFIEFFGSDFAALEEAMLEHLKNLPYVDPIANQTHYVVMLKTATSRTVSSVNFGSATLPT